MSAITRFIVWAVMLGAIAYDIPCAYFGWLTISEEVREIDKELGGLFRWSWLALWLHWFCPLWER